MRYWKINNPQTTGLVSLPTLMWLALFAGAALWMALTYRLDALLQIIIAGW